MINFKKQFENILQKYNEIESLLNNQSEFDSDKLIKLNKEYAELKPIVNTINNYKDDQKDIFELNKLIKDEDLSIKQLAEEELIDKKKNIKLLEDKLMRLLIPKDVNDSNKAIISSIMNINVSALNKIFNFCIELTKYIIDNDKIEPHNK